MHTTLRAGRARALLALTALLLALPAAASATTTTDSVIVAAAEALATDNVYVDPDADPRPTDAEVEELRDRITAVADDTGPIYVAVLPERAANEVGGSAEQVLSGVGQTLNRAGTYIVVVGETLNAGSTDGTPFRQGRVPALAEEAAAASGNSGDVGAVLVDLVDRLGQEATGNGGSDGSSGGGSSLLPLLVILGLLGVFGFFFLRSRRRRREQERREVEEVRGTVLEDLANLDRQTRDLDNDLRLIDESPEVKQYSLTATQSYARASQAVDAARRPEDFGPATEAIQEGLYAVSAARARLEGREPPERRVPCFFDPRHGASVRDVLWAPPGGQPREVPACAADALRVEEGEMPEGRQVLVGGERRSYWDAPAYYGPWAGGYYGGGGFLNGLLLGSWFGGGFGWGGGWGGGYGYGGGYGGDGGGDGGGFGGGDFGGDFGGGDFGGGDFGGGDFGGGDF